MSFASSHANSPSFSDELKKTDSDSNSDSNSNSNSDSNSDSTKLGSIDSVLSPSDL